MKSRAIAGNPGTHRRMGEAENASASLRQNCMSGEDDYDEQF
jgi:hypothetical protein